MAGLLWLPEAVEDLDRLLHFLLEKNPAAARRAAGSIAEAAELLALNTGLGRPMADGTERRELTIPFAGAAYILRYRLDAQGRAVVIRVWHGREARA